MNKRRLVAAIPVSAAPTESVAAPRHQHIVTSDEIRLFAPCCLMLCSGRICQNRRSEGEEERGC